jgi:putative nucleotidyltransferase with HDIG domain
MMNVDNRIPKREDTISMNEETALSTDLKNKTKVFNLGSAMLILYLVVCGIVLWISVNNAIDAGDNTQLMSVFLIAVLNISLILIFELLAIKKIQIPLSRLTSAAERMVRGNYDTNFDIGGDDQVARLAETFNELCGIMKASSESMQGYVKDLQNRIDELNFITELDDIILSFDNLEAVFNQIANKVRDLLDGDMCCIVLRSNEDLIHIKSLNGFSNEEMVMITKMIRESDYHYNVCPAMASDCIIHVEDIGSADIDNEANGIFSIIEANSMMAAPLRIDGQTIGSITVWYRETHEFPEMLLNRFKLFTDQTAVLIKSAKLVQSMKSMSLDVVRAFANSIDARDSYTANHSDRVSKFSVAIAQELGLSAYEIEMIEYAGLLHDLGKIAVKEEILNKPGALSSAERDIMKEHVKISAKIIEPIEFLADAVPIILHHHEWYNGKGYPDGLAGDDIPLGARILSVADSFEAMTSSRVYSHEISLDEAARRLLAGSKEQFDPQAVDALLKVVTRIEAIEALDAIDAKECGIDLTTIDLDPAV